MRGIGLHIRIPGSLRALIEKALSLHIPFFQCFFVDKTTGYLMEPDAHDIQEFLRLRREHFKELYVHGSYWINLAGIAYTGHKALYRELELAQRLEFTHIVLHPGSAKGARNKSEGIDALAHSLNIVFRKRIDIKIVLENTAHGNMSIGGDINDFKLLLEKIDHPEKLTFCIDTAHAYSYGYNIVNPQERVAFIDLIASAIGMDKVQLIHLNDTAEKLGSKMDKHQMLGQGTLGFDVLKSFVRDPRMVNIPILMELPAVTQELERETLDLVRSWDIQ